SQVAPINSNQIRVSGNVVVSSAVAGTATVSLRGSGVQTLSGAGSLTSLDVSQGTGGSVVLANNFTLTGGGALTGSGSITGGSGVENLILQTGIGETQVVNFAGTVQNATFTAIPGSYSNSFTLTQNSVPTRRLSDRGQVAPINNNQIRVSGNV